MINVNDLKPGITFEYNNDIYIVIESQHSKSGRGQAHVKAKIKNLRTLAIIWKTFTGGEKVKKAFIEQREMQYLYTSTDSIHFMDNVNFEQLEISLEQNRQALNFLIEGSIIKISKFENEILGITLPTNVKLTVESVEGAVRGDSTSSSSKKAILETGLEISVPLFIKAGEKIIVSTDEKKYVSRA